MNHDNLDYIPSKYQKEIIELYHKRKEVSDFEKDLVNFYNDDSITENQLFEK